MTRPSLATALSVLWVIGCAAAPEPPPLIGDYLHGKNFAYAVYDEENHLLHSPVEVLEREIAHRARTGSLPISDIYVMSHGWDFTMEDSARLYEGYRRDLQSLLTHVQAEAPRFQPFIIFVSWGSVTRPLRQTFESMAPYKMPVPIGGLLGVGDAVIFHLPSNWGETRDAWRIAIGSKGRLSFDPAAYSPGHEYDDAIRAASRSPLGPSHSISLSAVLDKIMSLPDVDAGRVGLHTVGHSFGAKLVGLATLDACGRRRVHDHMLAKQERTYVDTMMLISPAMKASEMYEPFHVEAPPPEIAVLFDERILRAPRLSFRTAVTGVDRKAIVHSAHDSATGWVFAVSQMLTNYDALADSGWSDDYPPGLDVLGFVLDSVQSLAHTAIVDVASIISEPVAALGRAVLDSEGPLDAVGEIAAVPFSPFASQRAMGNMGVGGAGVARVRDSFGIRGQLGWLTEDATKLLNGPRRGPEEFFSLSNPVTARDDLLGVDPGCTGNSPHVFDARLVYDGHCTRLGAIFGSIVNQLDPAAAHSDVRSYELVDGVSKRERTFHWVLNMSRGGRAFRAAENP